jgi:hypothetical protein
MRKIRFGKLWYGCGLLLLFAVSATPSHAICATVGQFNTPNLVFGTQAVGTNSLTQMATLTFGTGCGGTVTVSISSVTISGANAGDFNPAAAGCAGAVLNITAGSNGSCTLAGTFTPTAIGTRTATLTVSWSTPQPAQSGTTTLNLVGGDEVVYVSTGIGSQILTVDGTTGAFQILSNGPACGEPPCFNPTGAVVGPDAKIYVTDQVNDAIWRMNQDGSQLEAVYQGVGCPETTPCRVEGPSFSGSGTGDLYINTYNTAGMFVLPGVGTTAYGGQFQPLASVESYVLGGIGTAFDASGNLLAADVAHSAVWSISPPYTPSTSQPPLLINASTSIVGTESPAGVALNKLTGQIFVADPMAQVNEVSFNEIMQVVPPVPPNTAYTTTTYYAFTGQPTCETPDNVEYIQFDMTGRLFATTSTSPISLGNAGNTGCGKVWRIDPPESSPLCIESASPCGTVLVDLNQAYNNGIEGVCTAPCGLNATQAIGLAMPATQGPTQTVPLLPTGGTFAVGIPSSCTPTNQPPNNCSATISGVYPPNMFGAGDVLNVAFSEKSQVQYAASAAGTPYSGNTLAPVAGFNGDGLVPSLVCLNASGNPCNDTVTPGTSYEIFTTWQTNQANYCSLQPHLLKGDPVGGPYTSLVDTIINCSTSPDPGAGTRGQSGCSTTSSSSCLSDWPNTYGPVSGSTAGITATATITAPTSGASFSVNQSASATFACGQTPSGPPSIVVSCTGTVTNPAYPGTVLSVASGGPLPTSLLGTNTLSVNPNVDGGSAGSGASATYTVSACQDLSLGFNPSTVQAGKSTTVAVTVQSCNAKKEIAIVEVTVTAPVGRSCGTSKPLTFPLLVLLGPTPQSFMASLTIPSGFCAGTYSVTAQAYVSGSLVGTTSSSLVVTAH